MTTTPPTSPSNISEALNQLVIESHLTAQSKGWWDEPRHEAELIALMHSALSEALEAVRHGNPPDDKIPEFSGLEAELADVIIRIANMAGAFNLDIGGAVVAKLAFNQTRSHKHGGKKF